MLNIEFTWSDGGNVKILSFNMIAQNRDKWKKVVEQARTLNRRRR